MRRRSGFGWIGLIVGILLVALGIFTFIRPGAALTGLVFLYGFLAVCTGIGDLLFYVKTERHTGFGPTISLVSGILSLLVGLMLLLHPGAGRWAMSLLFPLWFIAHCISQFSHLPMIRMVAGNAYYYISLILNILGLVLGFILLLSPAAALFSLNLIIGFYLIILGLDTIILAFSHLGDRW